MLEPCLPDIDQLKLVRDGTEQGDRFPASLDPQSVPIHGKGPAYTMLFARAFAAFLKYFNSSNVVQGNWEEFFSKDVSVALAAAAVQDVDRYRRVIANCVTAIEDRRNEDSPQVIRGNFGYIFAAVGTLVQQIDVLKETLPDDIALRATIANLIKTRLAESLKRLVSWFNADQERLPADLRLIEAQLTVPEPPDDYEVSILGVQPSAFADMLSTALSQSWWGAGTWEELKNTPADSTVFGDSAESVFELANACTGHGLFSAVCANFLKAYARIVNDAKTELEVTLQSYDKHAPHYTLFLAFLKMFEYVRADINLLGGKHLDFYYRDVLRLEERAAEPARAHVVLELTKNAEPYELPAATEFKAGKDASKKTIVFTSDEARVVNQSVVSAIRKLYRDDDTDTIFVDPDITSDDQAWHPFETDSEIGSFGFAIASHYLYLAEGTRTITLMVGVNGYAGTTGQSMTDAFICRLTTAEGWLEVSPTTCEFTSATEFRVTIELDGDQPEITAFDAEVHAAAYDVALPILEISLKSAAGMLGIFNTLEPVTVTSIDISVDVVGFRSLVLSTDLGPADASKPFMPFGPTPVLGSSFVIGCQEAFSKQLTGPAVLVLTWRKWSSQDKSTLSKSEVEIQGLFGGKWTGSTKSKILDDYTKSFELPEEVLGFNGKDDPWLVFVVPYSLKATTGYVKLILQESLGHDTYASRVAQYVIDAVTEGSSVSKISAMSKPTEALAAADADVDYAAAQETADSGETTDSSMPSEPYTPELEAITLNYSAAQSILLGTTEQQLFDSRTARYYHVTSFGQVEQHAYLRMDSEEPAVPLMPLLRHRNALDPAIPAGTSVPHQGELLIGLASLIAPQSVSLLFQVEDGSADPLSEKPSPHLHFSYLSDGDWVAFAADEIDDRTSELLVSGVMNFAVPADATTDDTLLPGGLTWIRIAVGECTGAVCRLLGVKAQAVPVTFSDQGNDLGFLATPLPGGTISKLVTPVTSIKAVTQPYESSGSRMEETPNAFYTRVSERLRHKDRAIALWDIERLVLEAFPSVHRVKCLNHTRYEPAADGVGIYRELAGGHVTIVTIPDVSPTYTGDPLTPYTSLSVLKDIKEFLEERASCFATLHVRNPDYERLRVVCNVRLRDGSDETYCLIRLKTAITQFLAPWAFDATLRPSFGGRVYCSSLINFLEEQESVDYVTDFHLYHVLGDGTESEAATVVEGTRAISVLASVPVDEHRITALDEAQTTATGERCGCES